MARHPRGKALIRAVTVALALALATAPAAQAATPTPQAPLAAISRGTVQQEAGPLVVPSGEEGAVTTRVTVWPTWLAGDTVKARLLLPTQLFDAGDEDLQAYRGVTATCAVDGGAFQPCSWEQPGLIVQLPDTTLSGKRFFTYEFRIDAITGTEHLGTLTATLEVYDEHGVSDRGPVVFEFVKGTPEAGWRTTVLARDKAGVLWQYPSNNHAAKPVLRGRQRIGGGWNVYTSITPTSRRNADGHGDLVAVDRDGVLWYYKGSGDPAAPFKPRVRVDGGWNQYTALTSNGYGLLARDKTGVLWQYTWGTGTGTGTGTDATTLLTPRTRVGGGWNVYSALVATRGSASAIGRDTSGVLWSYAWGYRGNEPRARVGGGWNVYDSLSWSGTLDDRESYDDLVARDKSGNLWFYQGDYRNYSLVPTGKPKKIGWGWDIYDLIF
ncbi:MULTISPECIES: hypothetical protein [unclassified Streptomyces]|uniref:hypothetical protein n=1 Tax=unclassified Streptomyces TaxID=2593676 RepID=UPI0016600983|nr:MULTISPECIES: hypothetical protein [unclassified Streptomyces]MBD0707193.1 hypothetical protein [Streptomyces sp. CBMA291]MBD0713681.1 hypothetical protein [Streptomyces sp. CBMA370]